MDKKYKKIERELNEILISEINARFVGKSAKPNIEKVLDILEEKNREIVSAHQKKTISDHLPSLFSSYLQIQEYGRLWFDAGSLSENEFRSYDAKRNRLDALLTAVIIALENEQLIALIHNAKRLFAEKYAKAKEFNSLSEEAGMIRQNAAEGGSASPKDEASAVAYLNEIAPLKARIKTIEMKLLEVQSDDYLDGTLQKLRTALTSAGGALSEKSKNAAKYLFDRSNAVFQSYKALTPTIANLDRFVRLKEELERYAALFAQIGDAERKEKTQNFISTIESGIKAIQQDIEKQKQEEAAANEKINREVSEAYQGFLRLKDDYSADKYPSEKDKKKLASEMKKYRDVLLANGQRIKARDIERFLNSTAIEKQEEPSPRHHRAQIQELMFYKKAFFTLLPITAILAMIVFLRFFF